MQVTITIKELGSLMFAIDYILWSKVLTKEELARTLRLSLYELENIRENRVNPSSSVAARLVQLFYDFSVSVNQFLLDEPVV